MEIRTDKVSIEEFSKIHIPRWDELPDLDLYIEQVVSLLEKYMGSMYAKIKAPMLSKSMINNYVKNKIVIAPVNKGYTKVSVAAIFVICVLKTTYSMEEISRLIQYGFQLGPEEESYNRFCDAIEAAVECVFSGSIKVEDTHIRESKYIMDNFALSFASKLYVQVSFLYQDTYNNAKDENEVNEKADKKEKKVKEKIK